MNDEIMHIKSIAQLHEVIGMEAPTHPLISVIDVSQWEIDEKMLGCRMRSDLYSIALKDKSCGLAYGRKDYDFNEGVLIFTAPDQVMATKKSHKKNEIHGWVLFFHPDLIRGTPLGERIQDFHFFSYEVNEALHLSDKEQKVLSDCVDLIKGEVSERIDRHSRTVISSTLELMLNYSSRFYERQFNTRASENSDVLTRFDAILRDYYRAGEFANIGIPQVDYFAERVHLSANYLSDLLRKETGHSAKDRINLFIVDQAKTLLLRDSRNISDLAYSLGFNYPHYFSRLFKSKTGMTPQEYRQLN